MIWNHLRLSVTRYYLCSRYKILQITVPRLELPSGPMPPFLVPRSLVSRIALIVERPHPELARISESNQGTRE